MPKLLSLLLCFAMVFSLLALPAQAAKADASSVDGTYIGTGTGRNGDITLSVTIADGKITQIETGRRRSSFLTAFSPPTARTAWTPSPARL